MRLLGVLLAALAAISCTNDDPVGCDDGQPCSQGGISGVCLQSPSSDHSWCAFPDTACDSGLRYGLLSGDGLATECVADLPVDAGTLDASADAFVPVNPPITNGQLADLVLGQPDFTSSAQNNGGLSARTLNLPWSLASDGLRLWAGDSGNLRVLQWEALPDASFAASDYVLGKSSATSTLQGPTQSLLGSPEAAMSGGAVISVAAAGAKLFVADSGNNRVLIWDIGTGSGRNAVTVLGQTSFTTREPGKSASQMNTPLSVWTDGSRLAVSDTYNNRVLIWNTIPDVDGQPADLVIGRASFGLGSFESLPDPPTAAMLRTPDQVAFDGQRFFVADSSLHRISVWNGFPIQNGQPADFVIGQPTFSSKMPNAGGVVSALGLNQPSGVVAANGSLFVADSVNRRVLVYTPIPSEMGASADVALGQPTLDVASASPTPTQSALGFPVRLLVIGGKLYVVDQLFSRVLRFQLNP